MRGPVAERERRAAKRQIRPILGGRGEQPQERTFELGVDVEEVDFGSDLV